jgi:hypothetical protein
VLCRSLDGVKPPQKLADLNHIFFYAEPKFPGSGFGTGLNRLVDALNTDPVWVREHTRYLRLAKEWEEVGTPSDRRLLSAADIGLAKAWAGSRPPKAPEITPLQLEFIKASEAEDTRRQSAEAQRLQEIAEAQAERGKALAERERALDGEAEAQKREIEARTREAEQAKRVVWRTLAGLAAAIILALVALGFGLFANQQRKTADEQRKLAEQATNTANTERDNADNARKETQRQLDRANQALAGSINNDLDLKSYEPLTPRQRQALWKLAVANEPIKHDFVSILANSPEETIRVSPGFAQISRALGLLRPSAAEAEILVDAVIGGLQSTTSPAPLIAELQALLTEARAFQALDPVLKQIGQTTNPAALDALAQALQALAAMLTETQAFQALDPVLKQIGQTTNPYALQALAQAFQALAAKLTEAQAGQALDPVLKQIGQTTNPYALQALAQALQALPAKLTEAQAFQALDPVLKQVGQTTDPGALRALAQALQALAGKLSDAQASQALDPVLKQIGQTTDRYALRALAQLPRPWAFCAPAPLPA